MLEKEEERENKDKYLVDIENMSLSWEFIAYYLTKLRTQRSCVSCEII